MKRLLIIIHLTVLFLFFSFYSANAQIVTPSFDTSQPTELPSASSWRFGSTVAIGYNSGSAEYKTDDVKVAESDITASEGLLTYQLYAFTFEASTTPEIKQTITYEDGTTDTVSNVQKTRYHLAFRVNGSFSLGISQRTWQQNNDDPDVSSDLGSEIVTGKEVGSGYGACLQLFDFLFLAYGQENVTHSQDGYENNEWTNQYYGVSIISAYGFRLEWSQIKSPESVVTDAVNHNEYTDTRGTAEVRFGDVLFRYETRTLNIKPIDETGDDLEYEYTTSGIGYTPDFDFALMLSSTSGKDQDDTYSVTTYRLGVSYNF